MPNKLLTDKFIERMTKKWEGDSDLKRNLRDLRKSVHEWDSNSELRSEFLDDFERYLYFIEAQINDWIKYPDIEKKIDLLNSDTYRNSKAVKNFVAQYRATQGGQSKLGAEGELKSVLKVILSKKGEKISYTEVLKILEDDDLMENLFSDYPDPIPMENIKVDDDAKQISYYTVSNDYKERTISRIQSVLSEIRKSLK